MYVLEHKALFEAIRSGKPINNGVYMARSTMLAILGRMVDYTGQVITWDAAINSQQSLVLRPTTGTPSPDQAPRKRPVSRGHARRDEVCLRRKTDARKKEPSAVMPGLLKDEG